MSFFHGKGALQAQLKKQALTDKTSAQKVFSDVHGLLNHEQEIPVLTEIVALGTSTATREAVAKLTAECLRYKTLLAKWEHYDFREIVARCQADVQAQLRDSVSDLAVDVSEKMAKKLRNELRVAISSEKNEQQSNF